MTTQEDAAQTPVELLREARDALLGCHDALPVHGEAGCPFQPLIAKLNAALAAAPPAGAPTTPPDGAASVTSKTAASVLSVNDWGPK